MPQLSLTGLVKAYGAARALNGASLDLRGGEVHALMGENGAGKSTLIKVLAGLVRPDCGQITAGGAPVRLGSPAEAAGLGLRFLHQELQVMPGLSVAENMQIARAFPRRFGLVDWRALRAGAAAALARLGVSHIDPAVPISRLGPGDQMLVRIAATLVEGGAAPWLYVMDEPTAALSGAEAARLFAVIAQLKAAGAGVLYVSHRMEEVLALADRITVLRDGATVASHLRGQADQARIIEGMTGRRFAALYPPKTAGIVVAATGAEVLRVEGLAAGNLHQLDLAVQAGEVVGIAGLAGSGRNAALKALIGALPRRGRVDIGGRPLARNPAGAWAQGMAYVPRERRSEGVMVLRAVAETVCLPHLRGVFVRRGPQRKLVQEKAADVALKARGPGQPVGQLSGGNQQKVLFARAVAGKPRVLLLDEPTRGVDVGARVDIYGLIRNLAASGVAVVIASSDLAELIGLCDRIAVLNAGHMTGILPAAGLTEAGLLQACYDVPAP